MIQFEPLIREVSFMLFGKKKEKVKATDTLLQLLNADKFEESKVTLAYISAMHEITNSSCGFDEVEEQKRELYKKIYASRLGVEWFTQGCINYFNRIKDMEELDSIVEKNELCLNLYWYLLEYDPEGFETLKRKVEEIITPTLRRYYERNFNVDIYTGEIIDKELEEENAYKEHFYKASFAYNQGKGDMELSIREWRTFLNDLYYTLGTRPRVVFDFAREVVEHQKLFIFLVYAIKIEKMDRNHNAAIHAEGTPLRTVLNKVVNAVYAIDEEYGLLLKRYYA